MYIYREREISCRNWLNGARAFSSLAKSIIIIIIIVMIIIIILNNGNNNNP